MNMSEILKYTYVYLNYLVSLYQLQYQHNSEQNISIIIRCFNAKIIDLYGNVATRGHLSIFK